MTAPTIAQAPARLPYVDLLKVGLAIMVIGIHSPLFSDILPGGSTMLNQGLYRIAVPTFFCLSAYFLSPTLGTGGWWRWTRRILWLYAVWMTVYLPIWGKSALESDEPILAALRELAIGYWHLWYLIALALGIPMLSLLRDLSSPVLATVAALLSGVGVLLQYGSEFIGHPLANNFEYWRNALFFALPFLILGHLLRRHDVPSRLGPRGAAVFLTLGLILLLGEILTSRFVFGLINASDLRLSLLIAVPALTSLFLSLPSGPRALAFIPAQTGSFANGLYFLHIGVLHIVARTLPLSGTASTLAIIVLTSVLTLICLRQPVLHRLI